LKVAHINTNDDWGGGEHQVLQLLEGLVKRGIPASLYAHRRGMLIARARERGLPVSKLPLVFPVHRLARLFRQQDIELVHVHDSRAVSLGTAVAARLGIPAVYSRRVASPLRRNRRSRRKYSPDRLAAVLAISDTVKEVFVRDGYPPERVFVVPSGLNVEALDAAARDEGFRAACGGRFIAGGMGKLSVKKNWQMLLRTAAYLAKSHPEIHWVIMGEGPEHRSLEALARELGMQDTVRFAGFVADAARFLKSLDVLFSASLAEGAGTAVREAMAAGVPVVAVNAPGVVESLDGHGWVVGPDDIEGAAKSVEEALFNEQARTAVCARARASAIARFSFDLTVEATLRAYQRVLDRPD
jgi:L-malate glycosyltransferase